MGILKLRTIWYSISGVLILLSLGTMIMFGFKLGIDFTGGSLLQVHYTTTRPSVETVLTQLEPLHLDELLVEPSDEDGFTIKLQFINDDQRVAIVQALGTDVVEDDFETIGPTIGNELRQKSIGAIALVITAIVIYIMWAFRGVSKGPVPAWAYGVSTVLALAHDIIIPLGVFAVLGKVYGVEINALFITALLTILGFSVHDTIVVFDRIRENLRRVNGSFADIIGASIQQTLMRSLNTSVTVILVLLVLFLFGGESTRYFILALMVGISVGTYSSIFIASPLLLFWQKVLKK